MEKEVAIFLFRHTKWVKVVCSIPEFFSIVSPVSNILHLWISSRVWLFSGINEVW